MRIDPYSLLRPLARPAELALAERDRWPLWLPVALGAGAAAYFAWPTEPGIVIAWVLLVLALAAAFLAMSRENAGWRAVLALVAAFALGFAFAKLREARMAAPVLERHIITHLTARIADIEARDKGVRLILADPRSGGFRGAETPARLRLAARGAGADLIPGQWISLTARLAPPAVPTEPGAGDFARTAFFQSIGGTGFVLGATTPAMAPRAATFAERISDSVAALRWRMTQRVRAVLPGSTGAIATALITGERGGIAEEDETALRDAGLAHVLAIAGLHMALMGMGLFWLVRALLALSPRLALSYPIKKWAAVAALIGAGFYLVISGAAPPATRAFVMLAVALTAVLLDRPALSMRGLALAAAILIALRPEDINEPGFQMSFAAVAALIAAAEASARSPQHGVLRHLSAIFVTSAVASLATLPFALFHFTRATHYAVLGNLIAMPIMGFVVMPLAGLCVAAMPFGLEAAPLHWLGYGIDVMLAAGRFVSGLPGAVSSSAAMPLAALVWISLGGLWCLIWQRPWRWLGLAPISLGVLVAFFAHGPDLLVAPDAQTVALRGSDGHLHFITKPKDRFAAADWLKRDGDSRDWQDAIGVAGLSCDGLGCVAPLTDGRILAVSRRPDSLAEDCRWAAILVSAASVHCAGPRFIADAGAAMRDEGYALRLAPNLKIESVAAWRGARPWVKPVPRN